MPGRRPDRFCTRTLAAIVIMAGTACAHADGTEPPPHVPVAMPQAVQFRTTIEVSGEIAAVQSATIAAQRAGVVSAVLFHSGETVAKGQILLRLDDGVERAQVALDQAKLDQAQRTLARDHKLRAIAGVSTAQVETDQATAAEAAAQLALDTARENRRIIRAPFAGTLGIRRLSTGDYIGLGVTITSITQTSPLRVLFAVPETELSGIGFGNGFDFTLPDAGQSAHHGRILALSPALNTTTRARMVEGRIANAAGALLPGAFGTVTIATGTPVAAFDIPATAIDYGPLGSFIYAVDRKKHAAVVRAVYVKVLATTGAIAVIAAKNAGSLETVVALGGFKLHDGETIIPNAATAPLQAGDAQPGAKS
ncbi:MAG: efflux RND transporter periplasmic adaptor subunit [Acidiphilium sp.]|nr:efflux RND transporter periplasmic adaptor subunit [Acidiphilium sp.]MDD4936088.1 efflux RND transporter periplasmic adaptor subunit [Acidiphilium sp.]